MHVTQREHSLHTHLKTHEGGAGKGAHLPRALATHSAGTCMVRSALPPGLRLHALAAARRTPAFSVHLLSRGIPPASCAPTAHVSTPHFPIRYSLPSAPHPSLLAPALPSNAAPPSRALPSALHPRNSPLQTRTAAPLWLPQAVQVQRGGSQAPHTQGEVGGSQASRGEGEGSQAVGRKGGRLAEGAMAQGEELGPVAQGRRRRSKKAIVLAVLDVASVTAMPAVPAGSSFQDTVKVEMDTVLMRDNAGQDRDAPAAHSPDPQKVPDVLDGLAHRSASGVPDHSALGAPAALGTPGSIPRVARRRTRRRTVEGPASPAMATEREERELEGGGVAGKSAGGPGGSGKGARDVSRVLLFSTPDEATAALKEDEGLDAKSLRPEPGCTPGWPSKEGAPACVKAEEGSGSGSWGGSEAAGVSGVGERVALGGHQWRALGVGAEELDLHLTLLTGQTFRWRETGEGEYAGVVGSRLVCLRQSQTHGVLARLVQAPGASEGPRGPERPQDAPALGARKRGRKSGIYSDNIGCSTSDSAVGPKPCIYSDSDGAAGGESGINSDSSDSTVLDPWVEELCDYFNLGIQTTPLYAAFAVADARFRALHPHVRGYRLLRQDPLECLFQFLCSSNNNIGRITGMVQSMARLGEPLGAFSGHEFHAFPSLETLLKLEEQQLRDLGFGYRAKFVVEAARQVAERGGASWLHTLRGPHSDWAQAEEALSGLTGVGPKVAACVALFSLDQHGAVPVDVHVWRLAVDHYCASLKAKSLTAGARAEVVQKLSERFGEFCGWAVNAMFIAELASVKKRLQLP